jgi:hypothetical protein
MLLRSRAAARTSELAKLNDRKRPEKNPAEGNEWSYQYPITHIAIYHFRDLRKERMISHGNQNKTDGFFRTPTSDRACPDDTGGRS